MSASWADDLDRIQGYLQLRTDHIGCAEFLNRTINTLLPVASIRQLTFIAGEPVILATIVGSNLELPALLLNSHMDFVPANAAAWKKGDSYTPTRSDLAFTHEVANMKSVGMQYVEALGALIARGWTPRRTIHVSYVPDEEIGGVYGMGQLSQSAEWESLGIGFALDEGLPHTEARYNVFVGDDKHGGCI